MANAEVDVYNMALSALGHGVTLSAISDVDRGAELCNIHYETVRDAILRAAPWPETTGYKRLGLLVERDQDEDWVVTDPPPGWLYSYGVPSDYLWPRHLDTYARFFPTMRENTRVIATNVETPILVYTRRLSQVYLWNANLLTAVWAGLAAFVAKGLTGKDSDLVRMYQLAREKIDEARAAASNEVEQPSLETIPEWISARGYAGAGPASRYIYPPAEFTVSGFNALG